MMKKDGLAKTTTHSANFAYRNGLGLCQFKFKSFLKKNN
jgi:hypothetical protein